MRFKPSFINNQVLYHAEVFSNNTSTMICLVRRRCLHLQMPSPPSCEKKKHIGFRIGRINSYTFSPLASHESQRSSFSPGPSPNTPENYNQLKFISKSLKNNKVIRHVHERELRQGMMGVPTMLLAPLEGNIPEQPS